MLQQFFPTRSLQGKNVGMIEIKRDESQCGKKYLQNCKTFRFSGCFSTFYFAIYSPLVHSRTKRRNENGGMARAIIIWLLALVFFGSWFAKLIIACRELFWNSPCLSNFFFVHRTARVGRTDRVETPPSCKIVFATAEWRRRKKARERKKEWNEKNMRGDCVVIPMMEMKSIN